jgi:hypothetical protein
MKKILYLLLAVSIIFAACKKEDDNTSNTGTSITELEQILLAGESSALWTVTYGTSEHREGYILNGIKTYTDTTAATEIDSSGNSQYRFYASGDIDWTDDDGVLVGPDDAVLTYNIINDDRIELEGNINFFGYWLPIWMQWDITSKTNSRIEVVYDDFFPGDNPNNNDTVFFDCDQGDFTMERLN